MPLEGGFLLQADGFRILQASGSNILVGPQYAGFEVFDLFPNWADVKPVEAIERSGTVLDNVTGLAAVKSRSDTPRAFMEFQFTLTTRTELASLRDFLGRIRGRSGAFWMPTWEADFRLTQDITTTAVVVESVEYAGRIFPNNARKHIAIVHNDRTIYPRGVSAAVDNGVTETLTIDASIPQTVLQDVSLVCFLQLVRLNTDGVELTYIKPDLIDLQMGVTELPRETPAP